MPSSQISRRMSEVRGFVDRFLRVLEERREDAKEDMTRARIERDIYRDEAAIWQTDSRLLGIFPEKRDIDYPGMRASLRMAKDALIRAKDKSWTLLYLFEYADNLRLAFRAMNKFFIAIMEGKIARGHESFSDFLIERLHDSPRIPPEYRQLFELYIALVYGDATKQRVIPFAFAREVGFYIEDTGRMQRDAEEAFSLEKEEFLKLRWDYFYQTQKESKDKATAVRQDETDYVRKDLECWKVREGKFASYEFPGNAPELVDMYITLHEYKAVQKLLEPYYTARFAPRWRTQFPKASEPTPLILNGLRGLRSRREFVREWAAKQGEWPSDDEDLFHEFVLEAFAAFLELYKEGACVVLTLLQTIIRPEQWQTRASEMWWIPDNKRYLGYNALFLPEIAGREPLEILILLNKLLARTEVG